MTAGNSDNSRNVIKYTGQNYTFTPAYMRNRDPTTNDIKDPKNQGYYPFTALWINKTNQNLWGLVKIANNLATWILFSTGGSGPLLMLNVPAGVSPIVPDGLGNMTFTSNAGTITITGSAAAPNNHTVNFDLVGGGEAIDQIGVDSSTPPGTNPVLPNNITGQIDIRGGTTFATNTQVNPIRTNSLVANRFDIETQLTGSNAGIAAANKFGVAQFDSNQFDVIAGFVSLKGSTGPAATKFHVDTISGTGVNPVVPDATGLVTIAGLTALAGTTPIKTNSNAPNQYNIVAQISQALSSPALTKIGLSNYYSANFGVDADGFVTAKGGLAPGVSNLGISYAASTFTVNGADGSALSATNPAYVTAQSNLTPGKLVTLAITANQSFIDATGASQIAGNNFGTTAGVAWGNDCPFFLYAVLKENDTAIAFMISRQPNHYRTNSANIAKSGSAVAANQNDYFALNSSIIVTDYDVSSALYCGFFRMRKSAGNDWTVQTLSVLDGINRFPEDRFTFPTGQLGAIAGSYFSSSVGGNTIPTFGGTINYLYQFTPQGQVNLYFEAGTCTVSGVGAGDLRFSVPTVIADGDIGCAPAHFMWKTGGGLYRVSAMSNNGTALTYYTIAVINPAGGALLTPADIVNTSTAFCCQISYFGFSH